MIGGGVVGCESATWLRGLGASEVTLIEVGPSLLTEHEPFAGEMIAERFASAGSTCSSAPSCSRCDEPACEDTGVGRIHGGPATITAGDSTFEVDEIVVAAGRTPATADIGLDRSGLSPSEHGYAR